MSSGELLVSASEIGGETTLEGHAGPCPRGSHRSYDRLVAARQGLPENWLSVAPKAHRGRGAK